MSQQLAKAAAPGTPQRPPQPSAGTAGRQLRLAHPAPTPSASDIQADRIINDFQSDTSEIVGSPDPWVARSTLFVITGLLVTAIVWSALAQIDRIISARGTLVSVEPGILVQPFDTSIIRAISVREGDIVRAGQVLATLDPTFSASDVAQLASRMESLDAQIARLEAEREGQDYVIPTVKPSEVQILQYGLWQQRQHERDARLKGYAESLARLQVQRDGKAREIEQLKAQEALVREIESMRRELTAQQLSSKLNLLAAQRESINLARSITQARSELEQASHQIESVQSERDVYRKQLTNQIAADLARLSDERTNVAEQLTKARRRLSLVQLTTPVDAVVLQVAQRSIGSVVTAAEPLIRLVPLNAALEVESYIAAKDIGFVRVGDPVSIKLDAYSFTEYGTLEGEVSTISEDAFSTQSGQGTAAAYKTRIRLTRTALRRTPENFRLIPGLPLTGEIKIGTRSVLGYFLTPLTRGLEEGLREP